MRKIHKYSQFFSFLAVPSTLTALALLTLAPISLAAPPPTDWSIRNTGLNSKGACYRRARRAMARENIRDVRTSGDNGFKGDFSSTRAYIICRKNGAEAYMFCAGDLADRICDNLARYMKE